MMVLRPKSFRVGLVLLAVLLMAFELPPGISARTFELGPIKTCSHNFTGTVTALNQRQLKITDFSYDGKGRASWFHAMKKGAGHIFGDPADKFDLISNSDTACEKLSFDKDGGAAKNGAEVTLTLPAEIDKYETIGIFCHFACANFGFLKFDELHYAYPSAPAAAHIKPCPLPSRDEITKLANTGTPAATKCDVDSTTSFNYDCTSEQEGGSTEGGSGAADAAGSAGCIAGGVFAVSLLSTRN